MNKHFQLLALMASIFVGDGIGSRSPVLGDSSSSIDTTVQLDPREFVSRVLAANLTPNTRMTMLEPYVNVGRSREEIEKVVGAPRAVYALGQGFHQAFYCDDRLMVRYYPDGEAYAICCFSTERDCVKLRSDDPITWPKTKNDLSSALREKNRRP
jgi:hypothetical protein